CILFFVYLRATLIHILSLHDALPIYGDDVAKRIYSTPADKNKPLKVAASRSHQSETLKEDLNEMDIELGELISAGSSLKFCLVADRKSTRLNSSHVSISYAVFCLKKK